MDNPFGNGNIYKSGKLGKWTFEGKFESLGNIPAKIKSKKLTYMKSDEEVHIKNYDYTKVSKVLLRNSSENFKTISNINVRKYTINWWYWLPRRSYRL